MKIHSFITEILFFSMIFLGFILPPFFYSSGQTNPEIFSQWTFPWTQMLLALFALFIYYIFYEKKEKGLLVFPVIFTVSLLFCISLFMKFFSLLPAFKDSSSLDVIQPTSISSWIFCILNFLFAAFYEEIIYRFYLADSLYRLICRKSDVKIWLIVSEIFAGLAFAFAHLYLGVFSLINAALAHIVLRLCYKKSGTIWCGFAAHFIYNIISLILL
ncbi:MAG: CPBP family intramembrane metalloprotease [Treponema sp.]|nr:CPBP family intramembrane metalloprotease [Treponema sp.]